jgi:hypothetical protein
VQRVHAEAGVVGDRGQAGIGGDGVGLEQCVVREREAGLRNIGRAGEGIEAGQPVGDAGRGEDAGELGDLVIVARGEHETPGR